jgi:UDPglucose 6-dehydrogenase
MYSIGIIGVGVLGKALLETFEILNKKNNNDTNLIIKSYDKYNDKYIGAPKCNCVEEMIDCDIIFLCLPTEFCNIKKEYDKTEIYLVCAKLEELNYSGIVILKSTVEPKTTTHMSNLYSNLNIVHNPEFLTARTATEDYINQKHIVLGFVNEYKYNNNNFGDKENIILYLDTFFKLYFPSAKISICSSDESESMKLFCNSFYATKIQFFTEIKLLCDSLGIEYNNIRSLMLNNEWINPMHTIIPGPDGNISYGGKCFPKDIGALREVFEKMEVSHKVIDAVITENKEMRQ